MILYVHPVRPGVGYTSGGARKLEDHVAILNAHGLAARTIHHDDIAGHAYGPGDLVVVPEMYGDIMRDGIPAGVRRVSFVQNGHMIDWNLQDPGRHPYLHTPDLAAVWVSDANSERLVRERCPDLAVPLQRLRLSIGPPFAWGPWPRRKRVVYFNYKYEAQNRELLDGLQLPPDWSVEAINGTAQQVAEMLQTSAVFFACLKDEGWCGTTAEAMLCGALIACWEDPGPMEYLAGRAFMAPAGDLAGLRGQIRTAAAVSHSSWAARGSEEFSAWFAATYSREQEVADLLQVARQAAQSE